MIMEYQTIMMLMVYNIVMCLCMVFVFQNKMLAVWLTQKPGKTDRNLFPDANGITTMVEAEQGVKTIVRIGTKATIEEKIADLFIYLQ